MLQQDGTDPPGTRPLPDHILPELGRGLCRGEGGISLAFLKQK
jgi:hypothetical protein